MTRKISIDPITRLEGHGKIEIFLDDQGAKLLSAVSSIVDSKDPDEITRVFATLPDFTSFANRYSVAASLLQRSHRP